MRNDTGSCSLYYNRTLASADKEAFACLVLHRLITVIRFNGSLTGNK